MFSQRGCHAMPGGKGAATLCVGFAFSKTSASEPNGASLQPRSETDSQIGLVVSRVSKRADGILWFDVIYVFRSWAIAGPRGSKFSMQ